MANTLTHHSFNITLSSQSAGPKDDSLRSALNRQMRNGDARSTPSPFVLRAKRVRVSRDSRPRNGSHQEAPAVLSEFVPVKAIQVMAFKQSH
jgi:hypothetical protein